MGSSQGPGHSHLWKDGPDALLVRRSFPQLPLRPSWPHSLDAKFIKHPVPKLQLYLLVRSSLPKTMGKTQFQMDKWLKQIPLSITRQNQKGNTLWLWALHFCTSLYKLRQQTSNKHTGLNQTRSIPQGKLKTDKKLRKQNRRDTYKSHIQKTLGNLIKTQYLK